MAMAKERARVGMCSINSGRVTHLVWQDGRLDQAVVIYTTPPLSSHYYQFVHRQDYGVMELESINHYRLDY